jgi:PadR family transcriptional regulator PadR
VANSSRDLIHGTLDMLVLRTLARGELHGYGIALAIEGRSAELRIEEGALYPALHRLELSGLLKSEWKLSETKRRAKFYTITATGRTQLAAETANWNRLIAAVARVMEPA